MLTERKLLLVGLDAGERSNVVAGDIALSACLERPRQPPVTITVVDYLQMFTWRDWGGGVSNTGNVQH